MQSDQRRPASEASSAPQSPAQAPAGAGLPEGRKIETSAPVTGTATVNVALKYPNGLVLRVYEMEEDFEPILGGGQKSIKKAFQVGEDVVLNGSSLDPERLRGGQLPTYPHVGGFGITRGVPKELWEKWLAQNADLPLVKNGLIFAYEDLDRASAVARERAGVESGMEPIDPDNPSKRTRISGIQRGERPARAA